MFCARLFICALWSPAGKGLTSWLSFVVSSVSLSLSHWYPGSGVVLDCIDSWSLHHYLLLHDYMTLFIAWYQCKIATTLKLLSSKMKDLHSIIYTKYWLCTFPIQHLEKLHFLSMLMLTLSKHYPQKILQSVSLSTIEWSYIKNIIYSFNIQITTKKNINILSASCNLGNFRVNMKIHWSLQDFWQCEITFGQFRPVIPSNTK